MRIFDSTGHKISKTLADNLIGCRDIAVSYYRQEQTNEIFDPDFLQLMSGAKFDKFKETKLGRAMLGVAFRSRWEANVARYFEALRTGRISTDFDVINWIYEPFRFRFPVERGTIDICPDFALVLRGRPLTLVEVKGHLDKKSETQIRRLKKYYPDIFENFLLFNGERYRAIEKSLAPIIPGWEFE